jgi:hypothetical protein
MKNTGRPKMSRIFVSKIFVSKIFVSRIFSGILGAAAVSLTFGAVQLASGSDLVKTGRDDGPSGADENGINRAAKSDRADVAGVAAGQSQTISVRLEGLSATSILIRLPAQFRKEARSRSTIPVLTKEPANARKSTVACEPVVSVLTEVAKQLQPGRCVT